MNLGKNVKRLRALSGIALEPMAEAMGMDRAAGRQKIYAIEKRESRKSEIAPALAEYFGLPLSTLLSTDLSEITQEDWDALKREFNESRQPREATATLTQAPNTTSASVTLGPVPSVEVMRERVREAVANARARDALPAEARDLIFEVVASAESGVTPVIFSLISRHLADLTDTLRASLASVQPIDESLSGSKSAQSEKGQAAHRAKLPLSENQDKGHERSTGTEGNR